MAECSSLINSGQTRFLLSPFESAPASNRIHGAVKLSRVRHKMPMPTLSISFAISENQIDPFSMSALDSHGWTPCSTLLSHPASSSATCRLRSPDQLMKTFMACPLRTRDSRSIVYTSDRNHCLRDRCLAP